MKNYNLVYKLSIILLLISTLSACVKRSDTKIGFLLPNTTAARMTIEANTFKAKAAELGCEVIVMDAKGDEKLQRDQARELIDKGVNVLVIMAVNAYTAAEVIREAHNSNIKVIGYDRLITNCDLDFYISFNNYNVGKYMAEYALKQKPEGEYILLEGDKSDRNAILVRQGHIEALQPAIQLGKVKIVYDVFTEDWDSENAYHQIKKYIRLTSNNLPDVVLSAYDGMSSGAIKAIADLNINNTTLITGQDAEPQALKNIMNGKQCMTIYKPFKVLAENAVITAVKLAKNEKVESNLTTNNNRVDVPTLLFDPIVVDKTNIKQTVIADGLVKESDIMN